MSPIIKKEREYLTLLQERELLQRAIRLSTGEQTPSPEDLKEIANRSRKDKSYGHSTTL